jgi:thymidine phosphorylase
MKKGDPIDPAVGIEFFPKIGDRLEEGQEIAIVHARDAGAAGEAGRRVQAALDIRQDPAEALPLVYGWHGEPS